MLSSATEPACTVLAGSSHWRAAHTLVLHTCLGPVAGFQEPGGSLSKGVPGRAGEVCVSISSAHSHCHRCWVPWPLRRHFSSEVWVELDRPQGSHQPYCSLTCSLICFWMLILFSYLFLEAPMADPGHAKAPAAPFALAASPGAPAAFRLLQTRTAPLHSQAHPQLGCAGPLRVSPWAEPLQGQVLLLENAQHIALSTVE